MTATLRLNVPAASKTCWTRAMLLAKVARQRIALQEEFDALDLLDNRKTFDDCVAALQRSLEMP